MYSCVYQNNNNNNNNNMYSCKSLLLKKLTIEKKKKKNLLLCHVSYLIFNFVSSELLIVKIEKSKSN